MKDAINEINLQWKVQCKTVQPEWNAKLELMKDIITDNFNQCYNSDS